MSGRDKQRGNSDREHGFEQFALQAIFLLEEHGSRELLRERAAALAVSQKIVPGRTRGRTHLERAVRKEALVFAGDHRVLEHLREILGTKRVGQIMCSVTIRPSAHMLDLAGG